ncbi:MAG TPA: zf-HC2 domain-containing protein [Gemmatimonadaceae bacterium]|jgi:hypothetical protein|nr:zf-HC2 domain-containing protein [Gemmatimonadaceae bacterium]
MSDSVHAITCEVFADALMPLLEGELDGATRLAMEAHARHCAECGALLADLRRIEHDAARLPTLHPSRDLWSGVQARIQAPVVPLAARRPLWMSPRVLGFAAAAAILVAAGIGYGAARYTTAPAVSLQAAATRATDVPSPVSAGVRLASATPQAVEHSYDAEIAGLRAIITQRRPRLDSSTVAILEHNVAVIDSAIAQCKAALAKDPRSRFLMQSLNQSLGTKVQVLRTVAALPSTT